MLEIFRASVERIPRFQLNGLVSLFGSGSGTGLIFRKSFPVRTGG